MVAAAGRYLALRSIKIGSGGSSSWQVSLVDITTGKQAGDLVVAEDGDWAGAGGVFPIDGGKKVLTVSSLLVNPGQPAPAARAPARQAVAIVWDAVSLKQLERHVHPIPVTEVVDCSAAGDRVVCRRHS